MFDENEVKEKDESANNRWFYSTIVLVGLIGVGAVVYFAYYLGQKSTVEPEKTSVSLNTNVPRAANTSVPNTSTTNTAPPTNSIKMSSVPAGNGAITINGEMFVVTKGRENIKLALVDVCVLSEPTIQSWIRQKQERGRREYESAKTKLATLRSELQLIRDQLGSSTGYDEAQFSLRRREIDKNSEVGLAEIRQYYWISPEYYLDGIRGCEMSAKTDSNGRFTITLPAGRRYALAAQTGRRVVTSSETYWWLIWLDSNDPTQSISLNNDNLMAENPSNRVIPITRFIPSS